jgi:hypothetical protein
MEGQCVAVLEEGIEEEIDKISSDPIRYYGRIVHENYAAGHCKTDRERVHWSCRVNNK